MRVNWLALALCGIVVCAALVSAADAKGKAKEAKGDAVKEAPKERKALKDWQRMNDAAYRDLEDAWMDDEEDDPDEVMPTKWTKGPDGKRQPPMPRGPKMEMGFATLQPGTKKEQCEELAIQWSQLLSTGAVSVKAYAIEDDKILLGVDGGYPDMFKVKEFVLDQKETVEFEWQQQKFKPTRGGKGNGAATKEDRAAAAKLEREAELRRKVESGELFKEKDKAKAAAKAKAKAKAADAKGKAKVKAKAKDAKAAKPAAAKAKANAKPAAEKKKDSAKADAKKPKDDL